jgi:hypothetical protein
VKHTIILGLGSVWLVACSAAQTTDSENQSGQIAGAAGTGSASLAGMGDGGSAAVTAGTSGDATGGMAGTAGVANGGMTNVAGGDAGMASGGMAGVAGDSSAMGGTSTSGAAGQSAGGQGGGGSALDPFGPTTCLPAFETVCKPTINFENQDPGNSGNFDAVIQDVQAEMQDAICTMCSILYRTPEDMPRTHDTVNFIIDNHDGVAYAGGNSIHLSTGHIQNYGDPESAYTEFKGVMVHEATHLYQVNGGNSDGALIEGVADFVRVRAGYYGPGRCGGGDNWDGAYTTSGCFFSWLAGPCEYHEQFHPQNDLDIGYRINLIINEGKAAVQEEIESSFGVPVNTLWTDYKADY